MSSQKTAAEYRKNFVRYGIGFLASIALTVVAYLLVVQRVGTQWGIAWALIILALVQFAVQLFFFLHLGEEKGPRWKLLVLLFMLLIVLILALGSLWIMANLNDRMTPGQINQYMQDQGGSF